MSGSSDSELSVPNRLSRRQIVFFLSDMKRIDDPNINSPGRAKKDRPKRRVFKFRYNSETGDVWLNAVSFSFTKASAGKKANGYPTMPLRVAGFRQKKEPTPTEADKKQEKPQKAEDNFTRVIVHGVMWRLWNNFQQIPADKEISHLTDTLAVGRANLCAESGVRNKHRIGCHAVTLPGEPCRCGSEKHDVPFCRVVERPFTDDTCESYFDVSRVQRDEKAALKALPSSSMCATCLCARVQGFDVDNASAERLLETCICDFKV